VEHDLRAKVLRLRQKAAGTLSDPGLLRRLLADSVSTFCVLLRHALALHGVAVAARKREIVERAVEHLSLDPGRSCNFWIFARNAAHLATWTPGLCSRRTWLHSEKRSTRLLVCINRES
jgi:hypothetical protein